VLDELDAQLYHRLRPHYSASAGQIRFSHEACGKTNETTSKQHPITRSRVEQDAFDQVKQALADSATLAFSKGDPETCLITDASDIGWSVIVTQVSTWRSKLPIEQQVHELLVCMGGTFTGAQRHWSVIEKEAYPIVTACDKLTYLLLRPKGFRIYCDHRNLIHVFAPSVEVKKHVRGKLLRWAMKFTEYRYTIEHIDGVKNVWADMVSRWAGCERVPVTALKRVSRKHQRLDSPEQVSSNVNCAVRSLTLRPFADGSFDWPDTLTILEAQRTHALTRPTQARQDEFGVWCVDGRVWIPEQDRRSHTEFL
jgi:hypothetical protein